MCVIPAPQWLRQEDIDFKANLNYTVRTNLRKKGITDKAS